VGWALTNCTAPIASIGVAAYRVPTQTPETDGTFEWDSTTLVLVEIEAGGVTGIGYSYADKATATLIHDRFVQLLVGRDAFETSARWSDMSASVRNLGREGIASMAISAVDNALWDWKARFLDVPLVALLGAARESIPIYGSGGFTSYGGDQLAAQLGAWVKEGARAVKMKVGREPGRDAARVAVARRAIGEDAELFVDANGAYTRKQALELAQDFAASRVSWFEEPVSSDDLEGLQLVRNRAPAGMNVSAGEYGYVPVYFRRMLEAQAVDVLQADATRCCGITGFMAVAALCEAFHVPLSSHCAPCLHVAATCAARPAIHLEYFFDHARIEQLLFDGAPRLRDGKLAPDLSRPGLGFDFRKEDAECFRI
jgi:L-alanine-DL-glutamate epimerase-like enolase superfamily enzyme